MHLLHVLSKDGNETDAKVAARHAREQLEKLLPAEQVVKLTLAILGRRCASQRGQFAESPAGSDTSVTTISCGEVRYRPVAVRICPSFALR